MVDRFRSEDDEVESVTASSDDGGIDTAGDPPTPETTKLIRPVSESRSLGDPGTAPKISPVPPAAFTEWLSTWEDVRPEVNAPERRAAADELDETTASNGPDDPIERARQTRQLMPSGPESLTDTVAEWPPPPSDVARSGEGEPTGGEQPAEPRPPRLPSPPPVRSRIETVPATRRPIRASQPRPVSAATTVDGTGSGDGVQGQSILGEAADTPLTDEARVTTSRTIRLGGLDVTIDATQRAMLVTAAVGMVVVAGLFASLLSGLGSQTDAATRQADVETVAGPAGPNLNVSASSPDAPSMSELAQTTVRIAGLDDDGQPLCAGSGILVGEEGVILTNAHVVTLDDDCPYSAIAVGVTLDTSDPPELRYRGEVLVVDESLDLAVVRIIGVLSSEDPLEINPHFPTAMLGDSDQVDLGDSLRILGYPVIGGETITQTTGTVAGFVAEAGRTRALIKTDASISAGNSGGMAVNEAGEVIGIPTKAGANELGPPVDCREVSDTNNDGQVDNDDACVPIGGFLNSIRPINLARDLLSRAEAIQQDTGRVAMNAGPFDLTQVSFWNPRFSTGEENDSPVDDVLTLTQGAEEICLFVDWSGIPNGVPWAAVWSHDGTKIDDFSIFKIWEYGDAGRNFWYCAEDRRGHPAGVYEIGLFLNDELAFVESIEITEEPVEVFEVAWVNKSDQDICGLAVNPLAFSRHAGVNVLEPGRTMRPDDSVTIDLPAGDIVAEAYDCAGMAIAAELEGLSIPESLFVDGERVPLVIGGSTADDALAQSDE